MKNIIVATGNIDKLREIKEIFDEYYIERKFNFLSLKDIDFNGEIDECGNSFEENALIKVRSVFDGDNIVIADDSGICVDYLDQRPGIYSARYSGEHGNDESNNEKLLNELKNVPDRLRTARYVCAIACKLPSGAEFTVRDTAEGKIAFFPKGTHGFGYDPIFIGENDTRTWGEIDKEEKNLISHRYKALIKLIKELKRYDKDFDK